MDRDAQHLEQRRLVVRDRRRQRHAPVAPATRAASGGRRRSGARPANRIRAHSRPRPDRHASHGTHTGPRDRPRPARRRAGRPRSRPRARGRARAGAPRPVSPIDALLVPVEVGAAQPDGRHADDDLAGPGTGAGSACRRTSRRPWRRAARPGGGAGLDGSDRAGRCRPAQASLFLLADVEVHGDEQDERLDHELVVDRDRHDAHADVQQPEEQGADDRAGDRADAAVGGRAADERRRDDVELEAVARPSASRS